VNGNETTAEGRFECLTCCTRFSLLGLGPLLFCLCFWRRPISFHLIRFREKKQSNILLYLPIVFLNQVCVYFSYLRKRLIGTFLFSECFVIVLDRCMKSFLWD